MDDVKRNTLQLMEAVAETFSTERKGRHLIGVVAEYINEFDLLNAKRVLCKIETAYFDNHMYVQAADDGMLARDIATIINEFGLGFAVLTKPAASA